MTIAKKKKEPEFFLEDLFFLENNDLSMEELEKLVSLVAASDFRIFEKYLSRKQNRKAHAMITTDDTARMLELKAQIKVFGEITADLKFFWEKIKRKHDGEDPNPKISHG